MENVKNEDKLPWWQNAICYLVCASIAVWLFLDFTCIDVLAGCGFQDGAETSTHENWYCINFNYNPDKRPDNYTSAYIKVESDSEVVFYVGEDNVVYGMATEDGLYSFGHGHERDGIGQNGVAYNDRTFSKYQTVTECYWGGYMITSDLLRDYTDNVKIFNSEESAKAYIDSGDTSGQLNKSVEIPLDSGVIGNSFEFIGFNFDNELFSASWVDIWHPATNKSLYDGFSYKEGNQKVAVVANYSDGTSSNIAFFNVSREVNSWSGDSSIKNKNGSMLSTLVFTPYSRTGDYNPWNKGISTTVVFDSSGLVIDTFVGNSDNTVDLPDFKLKGVVVKDAILSHATITWTGTTLNSDLAFVPDDDTLVIATLVFYDDEYTSRIRDVATSTIGQGSIRIPVASLLKEFENSEYAWDGEIWLTPCYVKDNILYTGQPVIADVLSGTVSDLIVDTENGTTNKVDTTLDNQNYANSLISSGNEFYSMLSGLVSLVGQLPSMYRTVFGFMPTSFFNMITVFVGAVLVCRLLGR